MSPEVRMCHHCGTPVGDSPYRVVLQGFFDDHALPLCHSCQGMRQAGQLPVDLLVQQWAYAHSGPRAGSSGEADEILVHLDCLGCGDALSSLDRPATGHAEGSPDARRMPDGSLTTECTHCRRTNVLQRRGRQMVAVRLW